jgi:hypothetical protein
MIRWGLQPYNLLQRRYRAAATAHTSIGQVAEFDNDEAPDPLPASRRFDSGLRCLHAALFRSALILHSTPHGEVDHDCAALDEEPSYALGLASFELHREGATAVEKDRHSETGVLEIDACI